MSTYKHNSVLESKNQSTLDEHEEIIIDEYLPRLFAPATADWLFNQCIPLSSRKKPPQEDTGEYGEFPRG